MSRHDLLCPQVTSRGLSSRPDPRCFCLLIGKVRADERERNKVEVEATANWCREDERATLRAKVEALPSERVNGRDCYWAEDIFALIDGDPE
jgi:hypothetical protein